jgi:tetratricopeptide (TPR) repeat protein
MTERSGAMEQQTVDASTVVDRLEALLASGEYRKVLELSDTIQLARDLPRKFWFCKARALEALGDRSNAIEAYRCEVASLRRVPPDLLAKIGLLLSDDGRHLEGAICLRESSGHAGSPEYLVLLASALFHAGHQPRAREVLEGVLEQDPSNDEAWHNLGSYSMDRPIEAERAFRQALAINGLRARSFGGLAWALLPQRRWREAIEAARAGLEKDRLSGICHLALAEGLVELGELDNATEAYQNAFRCDGDRPRVLLALADLFLKKGLVAQAIEWYGKGLRAWPDDRRVRSAYIACTKAHGRSDPALDEMCSRLAKIDKEVSGAEQVPE